MANILVTGGRGFIGSHVARALAGRGDSPIIYDTPGSLPEVLRAVADQLIVEEGDILDLSRMLQVVRGHRVSKVVHTAALVETGGSSIRQPVMTYRVNIGGTINVLEAVRLMSLERVIDINTEEVYGAFRYEPADEDHPLDPTTPYAVSKVATAMMEQSYHRLYGVDSVIVRTCWVYGPGYPRQSVMRMLVKSAMQGRRKHLESGGDFKTDHTFIDDLVQGVLLALDVVSPDHRVYHVTSGKAHSIAELVETVKRLVPGADLDVGPGLLPNEDQKGAMDIGRARRELGYNPRFSDLADGVREYIRRLGA